MRECGQDEDRRHLTIPGPTARVILASARSALTVYASGEDA